MVSPMVDKSHKKKVVLITQARTGSTRLPGKVLMKMEDKTLLEIHLERVKKAKSIDEFVVATTTKPQDDEIVELSQRSNYLVFRGDEQDVLSRYYLAAKKFNADVVVRVTSDCPLVDPLVIDEVVNLHLKGAKDFTSNIVQRTFPDGMDVEVFSMDALAKAHAECEKIEQREHVTYYIWQNADLPEHSLFTAQHFYNEYGVDYSNIRLTLDYPKDLVLFEKLIHLTGVDKTWKYYVDFLLSHPEIKALNENLS